MDDSYLTAIIFFITINEARSSGITCGSWRLEASISNGYDEEHLIRTVKTTDSHIMCVAQCSQETQCITVGYSEPTGACDMYNTDLTDQQAHLSFQAATVFYKATCGSSGYTYIKHLNLCMKWHATVLSFDDARQSCQSEGGDLARLKTNATKMYLQTVLGRLPGDHHYWVGGRQTPGDLNDWQWIDGTQFNYTFWEEHEPDNVGEECSLMEYEHHQLWLENKNCELTFKYVCEIF